MAKTAFDELIELDRPLTELFHRSFTGPWFRPWFASTGTPYVPSVDMFARNGDLVVRLDLPGIDPAKDVTLTFEDGELVIKGVRQHQIEIEEEEGYYRKESTYGAFARRIPVPKGVGQADIKAEYVNGVLEIVIPHGTTTAKPLVKPIPIKTVAAPKS